MSLNQQQHIVLLYSKYSNFSNYFFNTLNRTGLLQKISIKFLCVDNEKLRQRIKKSKQIQINNIPCLLIVRESGVIDKFEGTDCFLWLEDIISKLTPKSEPFLTHSSPPPPQQQQIPTPTPKPQPPQSKEKSTPQVYTSIDDIDTDKEEDDDELLSNVNRLRLERENHDKQNIVQIEQKNDRNYDQKSNRKSDIKKNNLNRFVEEMQKSRENEEKNLPRPPIDTRL